LGEWAIHAEYRDTGEECAGRGSAENWMPGWVVGDTCFPFCER
jgi:hypothetical protein